MRTVNAIGLQQTGQSSISRWCEPPVGSMPRKLSSRQNGQTNATSVSSGTTDYGEGLADGAAVMGPAGEGGGLDASGDADSASGGV